MSNALNFFDLELLTVAFNNLKSQKLRSALSILGIVIGITAIITLISLGEGLNASVQQQFDELGTNTLTVLPGGGFAESLFSELEEDDADTIENIRGVESATAIYLNTVRVEFGEETKSVIVYGVKANKIGNLSDLGFVRIEEGRDLVPQDSHNIVIGPRLADGFFENEILLRENLKVNDEKLRVVGIMESARHFFGAIFNSAIVTTFEDLDRLSDDDLTPFRVMVQVAPGQDMDDVKERIEARLEKDHDKKDFQITSPQQAAEAAGSIISILQLVLAGIAAISLIVGGVVIMNTMIMAVAERTHEIGVLKAIGATNYSIQAIFLAEAALIGLIGGVIGVILGALLSQGASFAVEASLGLSFQVSISPTIAGIALGFSIVVGVLSGLIPAIIASRLDPIEAMRHH
ncbi:MAG: hypothetical protein CL943_03265 [Candidatus Diapherotrites archaeon]|uniref:ABC transporter permease n=1 Tax=Candidatus Iainarchaeum sp. TaxID=3101447 RepID=A0A2D6M1K3_9ARCH|nr:hypothetical protein [Candidatus Diapherotrites archaeon]|tara:strand:+ start:1236 stop:2450 length:1215 start_codon:yes stop_codon:yes gene_type:complete